MDDDQQPVKRMKHSHERDNSQNADMLPRLPDSSVDGRSFDQRDAADNTGFSSSSLADANSASIKEVIPVPNESSTLSKNQLKRLRKAQEWEAGKENRKAKRKQKIQEKKVRQREERYRLQEERKAQGLDPTPERKAPRKPVRLPVTFLIDCGFDEKMDDNERISLGSQLTRAYSDNSKAVLQAHLFISSWNGLLKERFDTILSKQYQNWKGVTFTSEDFIGAAQQAANEMGGASENNFAGIFEKYLGEEDQPQPRSSYPDLETKDEHNMPEKSSSPPKNNISETETQSNQQHERSLANPSPQRISDLKQQGEIVYLTSDSPNTLTELKPYSTYIIGGLVDKNRYKGLCYQVACDRNVATAKLPIGQYMEMQSRFILATNHVVEIMVQYLECGDWGEAFMKVIPKRKGGKLRGDAGHKNDASRSGSRDLDPSVELDLEKQGTVEEGDLISASLPGDTDQNSRVHQNDSSPSSSPAPA